MVHGGSRLDVKTSRRVYPFSCISDEVKSVSRPISSMKSIQLCLSLLPIVIIPRLVWGVPFRNSLNATLPANGAYCVDSRQWLRPDLLPRDCVSAGLKFFLEENADYQYTPIEFLAPGATPLSTLRTQTTPRRYTHCKLLRTA